MSSPMLTMSAFEVVQDKVSYNMPGLMNQALLPQGGTYQLKIISPLRKSCL